MSGCVWEVGGRQRVTLPCSCIVPSALEARRPNIDLPFGTVLRLTTPPLRHSLTLVRPVYLAFSHPSVTGESFVFLLCFLSFMAIGFVSLYPLSQCACRSFSFPVFTSFLIPVFLFAPSFLFFPVLCLFLSFFFCLKYLKT